MKQFMFALYDSKARVFCTPFFVPTQAVALRAFRHVANDEATQVSASPEDFTLFELGTWDDDKGRIVMLEQQINHGLATQFKEAVHVRQDA